MTKCLVKDCQNHDEEGTGMYFGKQWLCMPCFRFIVFMQGKNSQIYRNVLIVENEKIKRSALILEGEKKMPSHEKTMLAIAEDIRQYCIEQGLWYDCRIYFNGIAWDSDGEVIEDINPLNYFEYANPKTLSMSFEGPLYQAINYDSYAESDLQKIIGQYGYYLELGHAWNFSIYKI